MSIAACVLLVTAALVGVPTLVAAHRLSLPSARWLALASAVLMAAAGVLAAVGAHLDGGGAPAWLAVPAAGLAAIGAGSALTLGVLGFTAIVPEEPVASETPTRADAGPQADSHAEDRGFGPADPGARLLRGGALIGVFERVAVVATLLLGWPEGLAVLLALKGLGRLPELRAAAHSQAASERFILGTLVSGLVAAACAGVAALALGR